MTKEREEFSKSPPNRQCLLFEPVKYLDLFLSKQERAKLPHSPGVYFFKDQNEEILYVGKAKDLKKRISSYLQITSDKGSRKMRRMLFHAKSVSFEICHSEKHAYLRENHYLRTLKPFYNRMNTSPEYYSYLLLDLDHSKDLIEFSCVIDIPKNSSALVFGTFKSKKVIRRRVQDLVKLIAFYFHENPIDYRIPYPLQRKHDHYRLKLKYHPLLERLLADFLNGKSDLLLRRALNKLNLNPPSCGLTQFQLKLNIELLLEFYERILKRNQKVLANNAPGLKYVPKEKVDDWLVDHWMERMKQQNSEK